MNKTVILVNSTLQMSLSLKQLKEENEKLRRDLQESNQARDEEKKR